MAIIIYPSERGGLGDIAFMVANAKELRADENIFPEIVIVVDDDKMKHIVVERFGTKDVRVLTQNEFHQAVRKENGAQQLIPTLLIEGPTYKTGRRLDVDSSVPVLFTAEYSANEATTLNDTYTLTTTRRGLFKNQTISLDAGLRNGRALSLQPFGAFARKVKSGKASESFGFPDEFIAEHYRKESEFGLVLRKDLRALFKAKQANPATFKQETVSQLSPELYRSLLGKESKSAEEYLNKNALSFIYTHNEFSLQQFVNATLFESTKHNDIVVIGEKEKLNIPGVIERLKAVLLKRGFTHVVLQDKTGTTEIVLDPDTMAEPKKLRFIHTASATNEDIIRLISLSEYVTGVTGDMSFSECLALGNIPVYSCLKHKKPFFSSFIALASELKLDALKEFLEKTVHQIDIKDIPIIFDLPDLKLVQEQLHQLREYILGSWDYLDNLVKTVHGIFLYPQGFRKEVLDTLDQEINKLREGKKPTPEIYDKIAFLVTISLYIKKGLSIREAVNRTEEELRLPQNAKAKILASLPKFVNIAIQLESNAASLSKVEAEGRIVQLFAKK